MRTLKSGNFAVPVLMVFISFEGEIGMAGIVSDVIGPKGLDYLIGKSFEDVSLSVKRKEGRKEERFFNGSFCAIPFIRIAYQ